MAGSEDLEERIKQFTSRLDEVFTEFAEVMPVGHSVLVHPMPEQDGFPWFAAVMVMGRGNDPIVDLLESLGRTLSSAMGAQYEVDPTVEHVRGFVEFLRTLPAAPEDLGDGPMGEA